jgi:hypothetical protein
MPEVIIFVLVVAALAVLLGTFLSSRRYSDPSTSVEHFNRALAAMGSDGDHPTTPTHEATDEAVNRT